MELYKTTNGFICQILLGHGFTPVIVEYIKHLRMQMLFSVTPKLTKFLNERCGEYSFEKEKMVKGFELYHHFLNKSEKEIKKEGGFTIEKVFLDEFNNPQNNEK